MDLKDTETAVKVGTALFVQLLNKLVEKGILSEQDVNEMSAAADDFLNEPDSGEAFNGLAARLVGDLNRT
jgi:hypothetical protein